MDNPGAAEAPPEAAAAAPTAMSTTTTTTVTMVSPTLAPTAENADSFQVCLDCSVLSNSHCSDPDVISGSRRGDDLIAVRPRAHPNAGGRKATMNRREELEPTFEYRHPDVSARFVHRSAVSLSVAFSRRKKTFSMAFRDRIAKWRRITLTTDDIAFRSCRPVLRRRPLFKSRPLFFFAHAKKKTSSSALSPQHPH